MITYILRILLTCIFLYFMYFENGIVTFVAFVFIVITFEVFARWMLTVNKALRLIHEALKNDN